MSLSGFDENTIEPTGDFDQLPVGKYEASMIDSEWQPVSKKEDKGECISITWKVLSGEQEVKLFWQRLLLKFSGPEKTPGKVIEIAASQLSALCHATGKMHLQTNNGEEMFNIPCLVSIGLQKNSPEYTEVKSVKPLNQSGSTQQSNRPAANNTTPTGAGTQPSQGESNVPAFMRKKETA